MAVSVKTYLNFQSGQPEIRRFSVPEDVTSSFLYLIEKIQRVYPSLLRKDLQLLWQDSDGELITFSSDEELMEALQHTKDTDFLKIFIKVKVEKENDGEQKDGSQAEEHVGVLCDVCDGGIKGTRFKCTVCRNYDLCGTCESKGFHPEHEMLRIRKPRRQTKWCHGSLRGRPGPHRGYHCGRGGRPPFRGWAGPAGQGPGPFRCPGGPWFPPPPPPPPPQAAGPSRPNPNQPNGNNPFAGPDWGANINIPQYFHAFGEYLGNVLHPFGVDVQTYVDPPSSEENAETPDPQPQEASASVPMAEEEVGAKSDTVETSTTNAAADADPPDEVFGNSRPATEPVTKPAQDPDFVMVDNEKAQSEDGSKEKKEAEDPFQRRLDEAVAQMEAMGFKNDDGWLTQLLVSKDCDVGRVINTILPQGRFS